MIGKIEVLYLILTKCFRYILDMAKAEDGIVISNDQFRDLYDEFKDVINWRLLP